MIIDIHDENELAEFLQQCAATPVFLLKHSTRCPISAAAHRAYVAFAEQDIAPCACVLVLEDRECSNTVTRKTGVSHCSPQVILFADSKPVWHASHYDITLQSMRDALADAKSTTKQE